MGHERKHGLTCLLWEHFRPQFCTHILSLALFFFFFTHLRDAVKAEAETVKMPSNAFPTALHCQIFLQAAGVWVWLTEGERCLRLIGVWHAEALSTSLASSLPKIHNWKPFCGLCFTPTHPYCCTSAGGVSLLLDFGCGFFFDFSISRSWRIY